MAGMNIHKRPAALLAAAALILAASCVEPLDLVSVLEQRIEEANYVPTGKLAVYVNGVAKEDGSSISLPGVPATATSNVSIVLANEGDGVLRLTSDPPAALGGDDAAAFALNAQPAVVLPPGAELTHSLFFKPASAGSKKATLAFANDGRSSRAFSLSLSGNAGSTPAPAMELSLAGIAVGRGSTRDFPKTIRTKTSASLEFQIRNGGTAILGGCSVGVSGADASAFSVTQSPAATVAAGASTSFRLAFSPAAARFHSAIVTVNSDDPNYPQYSFNVSGEGTEWHGIAVLDSSGDVGAGTSLGAAGSIVSLAYVDTTSQSLKIKRSSDGSLSWSSAYSPDPGAGAVAPSLVLAGADVYVAYKAGADLRVVKGSGGIAWAMPDVVDTSVTSLAGDAALAWDGTSLLVGYGRDPYLANNDIYIAVSVNGLDWTSSRVSSTRRGIATAVGTKSGAGGLFSATSYGSRLWIDNHVTGAWISREVGTAATSGPDLVMASDTKALIVYRETPAQDVKFVARERKLNGASYDLLGSAPVTVDSGVDVGSASIACAPGGGTIYVSYYDATNKDLKLAKSTDGGAHWSLQTVDASGDVGQYSSVAEEGGNVYISYYDATNKDLKLAKSIDGGAGW
ncbi:MAG: choice-of-anchor D domain-containing protein [Spirochaetaceae bacterium]|nr:choice-of-anchor D domain-containing protein [Spirochaetaceae bacterium]